MITNYMIDHILNTQDKIREFAKEHGVAEDWHEADKQEVSARVTGKILDNAFGEEQSLAPATSQELVLHLTVEGGIKLSVNLADLLAAAGFVFPSPTA